MGHRIGYGSVFRGDHDPDSQRHHLTAAGCSEVFIDIVSGRLDHRPELDRALDLVHAGDVFVITRLVRVATNVWELIALVDALRTDGIDLVVLHQGIDTTTPHGRSLFHITSALADYRHDLIMERTREGLIAAGGSARGRPAAMTAAQIFQARRMYDERNVDGKRRYTVQQIAEAFHVARPTIYRNLNPSKSEGPSR